MADAEKIEKALSHFRKPYSCAQAVYAAYAQMDADMAEKLKKASGGRAPGGLCGAIYAAKLVTGRNPEELEAEFAKRIGSSKCAEIKGERMAPCEECVRVATELL